MASTNMQMQRMQIRMKISFICVTRYAQRFAGAYAEFLLSM